ncbi:MAG: class I SAM-dependent methyltransferase [Byssovorax sp.]
MTSNDIARLRCPSCRGALAEQGAALACAGCGARWPVEDGTPRLYRQEQIQGTDRLLKVFYDGLPSLHDPLTRHALPILQGGGREHEMRAAYMRRIDLGALRPRDDGGPLRVLEVGVGSGANLPLIEAALPRDLDVEIWGLDYSPGMLRACRRSLRAGMRAPRLLLGDAHALPFPDGAFDRVFHVGAMGSFRDPRRALAEMARVARRGTPIVVVDEQLDPAEKHGLFTRAAFRMLTFYDRDPHCPRELLPAGAAEVLEEQVSRFYYCLRFTVPAAPR